MKWIKMIFICCLVFLCSCNSSKPLSVNEINTALQELQQKNCDIEIKADPITTYTVKVDDELLSVCRFDEWEKTEYGKAKESMKAMLYFDVFHEDDEKTFSRVAVFSNNYILIQLCTDDGFEQMAWYFCEDTEKSIYDELKALVS